MNLGVKKIFYYYIVILITIKLIKKQNNLRFECQNIYKFVSLFFLVISLYQHYMLNKRKLALLNHNRLIEIHTFQVTIKN